MLSDLNFTNAARLVAAEGAGFVPRSSSNCLMASWTASIRTTPKEGGFESVASGGIVVVSWPDVTMSHDWTRESSAEII